MKKLSLVLLLIFFPVLIFSQTYRIIDSEFDVQSSGFKFLGKTRQYPLKHNFPLDKNIIFESLEELENYLQNYERSLISSRHFDEVNVNYEARPSATDDCYNVTVLVHVKDSNHLIVMPYPRYSSNDGISLKLKGKDTNFLGSLNTMNVDINLSYNEKKFKPGFNFNFNAPFSLGPLDVVFVNNYSLNYAITEEYHGFEWDTETGLELSHSFRKVGLSIGLYQYTHRNLSYLEYNDDIYFTEKFSLGVPITLATLPNFSTITYEPSVGIIYNWDFDGIDIDNDNLSSPEIYFSHSISNGKITWNDNFRKGYDLNLSNSISYNIQRQDIVPSISFEGKFFWNYKTNDQDIWNRMGICTDFYIFHYFDIPGNSYYYGNSIGNRLRGILDNNYFGNEDPYGTASSAIVFNIDLPHNVFTAYFPKDILNFNLQFSPFFDMALIYDRNQSRYFNFEDGFYCAGFEFLIYPLKWSSITVRASVGIDLSKRIFIEGLKNNKEIFIGIGLQY